LETRIDKYRLTLIKKLSSAADLLVDIVGLGLVERFTAASTGSLNDSSASNNVESISNTASLLAGFISY